MLSAVITETLIFSLLFVTFRYNVFHERFAAGFSVLIHENPCPAWVSMILKKNDRFLFAESFYFMYYLKYEQR